MRISFLEMRISFFEMRISFFRCGSPFSRCGSLFSRYGSLFLDADLFFEMRISFFRCASLFLDRDLTLLDLDLSPVAMTSRQRRSRKCQSAQGFAAKAEA